MAGFAQVGGRGFAGARVVDAVVVGVFEVAVVVVGSEVEVREVLVWVAGAPFLVLRIVLALHVLQVGDCLRKRTIIWMWTNLS